MHRFRNHVVVDFIITKILKSCHNSTIHSSLSLQQIPMSMTQLLTSFKMTVNGLSTVWHNRIKQHLFQMLEVVTNMARTCKFYAALWVFHILVSTVCVYVNAAKRSRTQKYIISILFLCSQLLLHMPCTLRNVGGEYFTMLRKKNMEYFLF